MAVQSSWHRFEGHAQPLAMINGVLQVQAHKDQAMPEGTSVGEGNGHTVEMLSPSYFQKKSMMGIQLLKIII